MRRYGVAALESRPRFAIALLKAKKLLEKYGATYIFLYRYPKGLRTVGALPVALTDIPWLRFTLLNATSAALWACTLISAGYFFGETIRYAIDENWGLFSVALLGAFLLITFFFWRRVNITTQ